MIVHIRCEKQNAGAELCQAQVKIKIMSWVEFRVEVKFIWMFMDIYMNVHGYLYECSYECLFWCSYKFQS